MKNELRVSIPDEIIERMAKATTADAARAEGVAIARDMLARCVTWCRARRSARPSDATRAAVDVLEALGGGQRKAAV